MRGGERGGGGGNVVTAFLDDLRHLRANAVLIVGVLVFGLMVTYHSDRMFGDASRHSRTEARLKAQREEVKIEKDVVDIEKAMKNILEAHEGVSMAADDARKAVEEQHAVASKYQATLILPFQSDSSNLHLALRSAASHSFVREILLWQALADPADAMEEPPTEIYGTPVRYVSTLVRRDIDKYQACSDYAVETSNVCIIQSVSRDTSGYLRSLYHSFLRDPTRLHVAAGALSFYSDMQLRVEGEGLHGGFSSLAAGAVFLRQHAREFVDRTTAVATDEKSGGVALGAWEGAADVYFTLWLNHVPVELAISLVPYKPQIDEVKVKESDAFAKRNRHKEDYLRALKELQTRLYLAEQEQPPSPPSPSPPSPSDALSVCGGGECLFISNSHLLDPIKGSLMTITGRIDALLDLPRPPPAAEVFRAHQYHFAVDADPSTQWVSARNVSEGTYYGLDLLRLHKDLRNVSVLTAHPFQDEMVLEVSMRGQNWYPVASLPSATLRGDWHALAIHEYVYDLSEALASAWQRVLELPEKHHKTAPTPPLYIRYLRFRSYKSHPLPLTVFDIRYGVGESLDGIDQVVTNADAAAMEEAEEEDDRLLKEMKGEAGR